LGEEVNIITPLHTRTSRDYIARMTGDKAHCSAVARRYGRDYWDGDRRYGYGGYRYDGRWEAVAHRLVERYALPENARILDAGCGKAHLLYEFSRILPRAEIAGFDISRYAIENAPEEIRDRLFIHRAEDPFPFPDKHFDLVFSLMTLHNLELDSLLRALAEIERTGRRGYAAAESYRSVEELFNLQCWALTCESFFRPEEWKTVFGLAGYTGDYEFAFFE
jgi:SAM-dependent methyltransferase